VRVRGASGPPVRVRAPDPRWQRGASLARARPGPPARHPDGAPIVLWSRWRDHSACARLGYGRDPARRARLCHDSARSGGESINSLMRGVAALATFVILAVLVALGVLGRFDRAVLDIVQVPHASWLDIGASLISILGQTEVVGTIALAVAIARLRARRRDWWVPLLILVVIAIEFVMKPTIPQAPPPAALARS